MIRLLGLALLMVLAGAVFFRFEAVGLRTGVGEWTVYEGRIADSQIDEVTTLPTVTYVYEVEGATYEGDVVAFDLDFSKLDLQEMVDFLDYYVEGTAVEVWVHPDRPSLCALETADMPLVSVKIVVVWSLMGFLGGLLAIFPSVPGRLLERKASWPEAWTQLSGRLANLESYGGVRESLAWREDGLYETPEGGKISGWSLFVTLGAREYADFPLLANLRCAHMPARRTLVWESFMELEERHTRNFLKGEGRGFRPHVFIRSERGMPFVYGGQVQYLGHELYPDERERTKRKRLHDATVKRLNRVTAELEALELDASVDVDVIERCRVQLHDLKHDLVSKRARALGRLRFSFSVRVAPPPRFWREWGRQGAAEAVAGQDRAQMMLSADDVQVAPEREKPSDNLDAGSEMVDLDRPIVDLEMPEMAIGPVVEISMAEESAPQVSVEAPLGPTVSVDPAVTVDPAVEIDIQPNGELEIEIEIELAAADESDDARNS